MSSAQTTSASSELLINQIDENDVGVQIAHVITPANLDNTNGRTDNANTSNSTITSCTISRARKYIIAPKLLLCKMAHILRELVLIFLVFVVYASFTKQTPKVTKIAVAYPFFPKDSVTLDFYRGHLNNAVEYARQADLSFVMYYAPWDAESQLVRHEFELAAKGMQGTVLFAAVNCWQPNSQCRRRYSRVYTWPVLIAYPAHGKGLQYNGPKTSAHMQKFLYELMAPFIRVTDKQNESFLELRAKYDSVILVKVTAHPGSRDYATVYHLSLRLLQRHSNQNIIIAVKTVKNTPEYKPEMSLYSWNETLFYPEDKSWKLDDLDKWIFDNIEQVAIWVSPIGSKSTVLLSYIQGGPTMVLFTPRNPLVQIVDYYQMYRQIAIKYNNCGISNNLTEDIIYFNRIENYISYKNQLKSCLLHFEQEEENQRDFKGSVTLSWSKIQANNSLCKNIINTECSNCKEYCSVNSLNLERLESCEKKTTSIIAALENDTRSPLNLNKLSALTDCAKLGKAINYHGLIFAHSVTNMKQPLNRVDITGLACGNNSLTMIAMDSLKYHSFAERLGVDVLNAKEKTAVVIINEKQETHHVLTGHLTENKLERFIYNFTQNSLPRAKLSSPKKVVNQCGDKSKVCIHELTSDQFLDVISQENKTILILFYASHSCIFCPTIAHIYLLTTRLFRYASHTLLFTRINAESETLPWPYNMPTLPTILINNNFYDHRHLRNSKWSNVDGGRPMVGDSKVFDIGRQRVSVEGLVEWILGSLKGVWKVEAWWSVCVSLNVKPGFESAKCFTSLRLEVLSLTESILRQWRISSLRLKPLILRKLQNLRQLHLLLAYTPYDITAIRNHFTLYTHR